MSHRVQDKQSRREARLRAETEARRREGRQRLVRRAGFGAVAVIAATLVTLAVVLGGKGSAPAGHDAMGAESGPRVGTKAPDFALTDVVSGKQVSAGSLRGRKTMLFFSEGVSCQACMVQAAGLEKVDGLREAGIRIVSVTTDAPGDLATAARQYGIRTPLLADPSARMSSAYGMLGHGGMGHATQDGHAFMLLGADGTVLWHRAYQEMYVKPQQLLSDMKAQVSA